MTVHDHGDLPIFPQQHVDDFVDPIKGTGKYSNYAIFSTTQALEDAPLHNHVPGEGNEPSDVAMSRRFTGKDTTPTELDDPGMGHRQEGARFNPTLWRGVPSAEVFGDEFGHEALRESTYSTHDDLLYHGLGEQNSRFADPGHGLRNLGDTGVAESFGRTNPLSMQSASVSSEAPLADVGRKSDNIDYGIFNPNEWRGLPGSRAL